ncbi:hypothetical protein SAMN05443575_2672 [Jatrophihabitans endophyticus]|uniref:SalK n=1 Tax=Jatrophihabitans endophyticus TaxID=1206085 RepID=A0A1M5MA07_9ACTN|nr:hypothetical protein [Jatrophihabitans endophyticus]SHG74184.1 hypothetical protein SAMN05443575_2672 [Jatrophihabitans endophyticus]
MTDAPGPSPARVHRALEPLHALVYFAPEGGEEYRAVGLDRTRYHYFASRAAAMGPVPADVVVATFFNFSPALVTRAIPRAWELASCETILAARYRVVDRALRRLLGEDVVTGAPLAEAAELARAATVELRPEARPLYAAHASLPWPDAPHLVFWHAITLLREHRGDGHLAALLATGLTGLEALVTHTATGRGFTEPAAKLSRGWSDEQWSAAVAGLRERGLLDGDGGPTAAGAALRADLEDATDRMDTAPWLALGAERTARLHELGRDLSRRAVAAGAFPDGVFASPRA